MIDFIFNAARSLFALSFALSFLFSAMSSLLTTFGA